MVYGVGIDIEDHNRFKKHLENGDSTKLPIYTERELQNYSQYNSHLCYALSFSCKESVFKAFGQDWGEECMWNDIELLFSDVPEMQTARIVLNGRAKSIVKEMGIKHPLYFKYQIDSSKIIFQSVLICEKN